MQEEGKDSAGLWDDICDIVVKTMCTAQPHLAKTYKAGQGYDYFNGMCFEVLGFDVLIDEDLKPWLLEVNFTPSFTTDSALDVKIKSQIVNDTLKLVSLPEKLKKAFDKIQAQYMKRRNIGRRTLKEHAELRGIAQDIRDSYEDQCKGAFIKIYPAADYFCYTKYLKLANLLWTGGRFEVLHVPRPTRIEGVYKSEKENKLKKIAKCARPKSPLTPIKLDGQRTSPTRMKLISKAINYESLDFDGHSRSKSNFIATASDLHF